MLVTANKSQSEIRLIRLRIKGKQIYLINYTNKSPSALFNFTRRTGPNERDWGKWQARGQWTVNTAQVNMNIKLVCIGRRFWSFLLPSLLPFPFLPFPSLLSVPFCWQNVAQTLSKLGIATSYDLTSIFPAGIYTYVNQNIFARMFIEAMLVIGPN